MATYTTISNAAVAVGAIPSSTTVQALRDNPIAIAEAATGAPVAFSGWHPVDKVSVGDAKDGIIYNISVNGVVADIVTPDFEDGYEYKIVCSGLSHNSGSTRTLALQAYAETPTSYVTVHTTDSTLTSLFNLDAEFTLPRVARRYHFTKVTSAINAVVSTAANVTAVDLTTSSKILRARLIFSTGSVDDGKVWLFRRREYASSP